MNNIFVTINLALIAAVSLTFDFKSVFLLLAGIGLCILWKMMIKNYRQLNSIKYEIIHELEKELPYAPLKTEWDRLKKLNKMKKYRDRTKLEAQAAEAYERLKTCLIMEKVGQYPSLADLQMFDIEKYRSVLSKDHFRDFKTALGLYASGVGCGSFVYLRRIFEGLVAEAETLVSQQNGWSAEEYERRRFNEKIEYLEVLGQQIIPDELVGVKGKIYGILSRGVHESSDQECKELFPAMKFAIEEVLDHRIAIKEREEKLKRLGTVVGKV